LVSEAEERDAGTDTVDAPAFQEADLAPQIGEPASEDRIVGRL